MTSLLPVCLALLLPACVLGQPWLKSSRLLYQRCLTEGERQAFRDCDSSFLLSINSTEEEYRTLDGSFICEHTEAWVSHTVCVNAELRVCQPGHQDLIVEADSMRSSQQYWCEHRNQIRMDCVDKYSGYVACYDNATNQYDLDVSDSGLTDRVCSYLNQVDSCQSLVGSQCGGHDPKVYSTYWKMTYPPACASASLLQPFSFLFLSACAVLLSKMAAIL